MTNWMRFSREEWLARWHVDAHTATGTATDAADPVLIGLQAHIAGRATSHPQVIALGGSVAVGKSTFAAKLAAGLAANGASVAIVGTDGFLHPNAYLEPRGLLLRKGFPESYDVDAIVRFVDSVLRGDGAVVIPEYSHEVFDIVGTRTIEPTDLVILEGVNALQPTIAAVASHRVYLHADEDLIVGWFTERFLDLTELAETDESSFYRRFVHHDRAGRIEVARQVWDGINRPNLHEHILGTREFADTIVTKRPDHLVGVVDIKEAP